MVRRLGISSESGEAVVKTIEQLEAYVAAEDAGTLPPAADAEAPAAQPDAAEPAATVDVETQAE